MKEQYRKQQAEYMKDSQVEKEARSENKTRVILVLTYAIQLILIYKYQARKSFIEG